ncbi:MAG: VCBS repeat-containing protein, partial [Sphingobacteriaceae bacterium]
MPKNIFSYISTFLLIAFSACQSEKKNTLFTLQDNETIGIDFVNTVTETDQTNVFTFRNFYNGGGVAIGDVNNDGLNDVFLTSNQNGNQLYLNQGN